MSVTVTSPTDALEETPRRSYGERLRLMRSKWNEEWWSIMMGGPIGIRLNALIGDFRWVTPNRITIVGFLCKVATCALLVAGGRTAEIVAIVLLQLAVVADCMDGSLARYRKASSVLGGYLDKVTDAIGFMLIFAGLGWRVYRDTGDAAAIIASLGIGASLTIRGYVYWVVAAIEAQTGAKKSTGVDTRIDFATLTTRERAVLYLKSMAKIGTFAESDLYFWIGLGLLIGEARLMTYGLAIATGVWFVLIMAKRLLTVIQIERSRKR